MKSTIPIFSFKLCSALCVLLIDAFGQINENKSHAKQEPILHVSVVSHFDQPWAMGIDDLNALRTLTKNHPMMQWTHLYNPVAYTQLTPHFKKMESFVKECRDDHGAEIGVHLHMYESLLKRAGVKFRNSPSMNAKSVDTSHDDTGYSVPMTIYSRKEIDKILNFTLKTFKEKNLGRPRSFCAGFYATSIELQKAITANGYYVSAAAFPPGNEFGAQYAPTWHELAGWNKTVTVRSRPYKVSEKSILPIGTAPYIKAKDGNPLIEFPQTCKIDWMVSSEHMKTIFREHLKFCKQGQMSAVCLAIHENNAAQHLEKYDHVLNFIDEQILSNAKKGISIRYSTLSVIRKSFLEKK
ncbi:hypothetical protein OAF35_02075 [Verrucomicrobiales bacterium]|nr:hypothetical protein [Verrucomicrobiales bacterium]|tara:strand:- start:1283 stop:2341 length:1059 start_codon:yes stop_codon:yes gene_type:complete